MRTSSLSRRGLALLPWGMERLQRTIMNAIVDFLIFVVLVALGWGALSVVTDLAASLGEPSFARFKIVTTEILSVFIFIEVFTLLVGYIRNQRLRLTNLVDASLAVVLRELWVQLYSGHAEAWFLLGVSTVLLALGALRVASIRYSPGEESLNGTME